MIITFSWAVTDKVSRNSFYVYILVNIWDIRGNGTPVRSVAPLVAPVSTVDLGLPKLIHQTRFIENSSGQCELMALTNKELVRNSSHSSNFRLGQRWRDFDVLRVCAF